MVRAAVDIGAPDFTQQLRALSPELVIHCVGPFQGQDYRVADAVLAAGAHYLDLADGRQFIAEFAARVKDQAVIAGRVAISGASTLPALSSAVVEELRVGLSSIEFMMLTNRSQGFTSTARQPLARTSPTTAVFS